eukprot:scaffold4078_cov68-Phaeocystis_antarctica.AAC.13
MTVCAQKRLTAGAGARPETKGGGACQRKPRVRFCPLQHPPAGRAPSSLRTHALRRALSSPPPAAAPPRSHGGRRREPRHCEPMRDRGPAAGCAAPGQAFALPSRPLARGHRGAAR